LTRFEKMELELLGVKLLIFRKLWSMVVGVGPDVTELDIIFGQGTILEPSTFHIGGEVALDA
jgi:hypothetical protein